MFLGCLFAQQQDFFCGVHRKNLNPRTSANPEYYDRFGNGYDEDELLISNLQGYSTFDCQSGYFTLHFDNAFTDKEKEVFCRAFKDISGEIDSKHQGQIDIAIHKSTDDPALLWATPIYSHSCGIQGPIISNMIMTGNPTFSKKPMYVGEIFVNSDYLKKGKFYLDELDEKILKGIGTTQIDLYTVVTHEILHLLGFASLIGSNGQPLYSGGYSPWDKFLYSDIVKTKLIEPVGNPDPNEFCCNKHQITKGFTPASQSNDCSDKIFFQTATGQNIAPITNSTDPLNQYNINALSHLYNDCNGIKGPFVMHPYPILANRVFISDIELQILCELGYQVKSSVCKADCFAVATDDTNFPTGKTNNKIIIPFITLLANDANYKGNPTLANVPTGLTIATTATGFEVLTAIPGDYKFTYKIEGCDGKQCDFAEVFITIIDEKLDVNCNPSNDCDLLCYGDFENFYLGEDEYFKQLQGKVDRYLVEPGDNNSPDIIANPKAGGNKLLQMHNDGKPVESIYLQLRKPIEDGCEAVISFDGVSQENNTIIQFFAFSGKICKPTAQTPTPVIQIPAIGCNSSVQNLCLGGVQTQSFYCMGQAQLEQQSFKWVGSGTNLSSPETAIFTNSSHRTFLWKNTTGKPIDKILVWVYDEKQQFYRYCLDNFRVQASCDKNVIAVTSEIIAPFQPGQTAKVKYTFQATTPKNGIPIKSTLALKADILTIPTGLNYHANNDFTGTGASTTDLIISSGETKTLTLEIDVLTSINIPYSGKIHLNVEKADNLCYSPNIPVNKTTIDINEDFTYVVLDYCTKKVQFFPSIKGGNHFWTFTEGIVPNQKITISTDENPIYTFTQSVFTVKHQVNSQPSIPIAVSINLFVKAAVSPNAVASIFFNGNKIFANTPITLSNNLLIDVDFTFDNCIFIAAPGTKITIPEGVKATFNKCQFYSCDVMWQGIEVLSPIKNLNGGEIIMTNCPRVEDAHNAIKLNDRTSATITNNVFSKNYVGVYGQNARLYSFLAADNKHIGAALKLPFKGQIILPVKKSYVAYWFIESGIEDKLGTFAPIHIGASSKILPREFIENSNLGIFAENTPLQIDNVSFKNIQGSSFYNPFGIAIFSKAIEPNTLLTVRGLGKNITLFDNCVAGVYAINTRLYVYNTKMENVSTGVRGENTPGFIQNNYINCSSGGIGISNTSYQHILENEIHCTNPTSYDSYGIWLEKSGSIKSSATIVEQNTIDMTNTTYGIRLSDANNIQLLNNRDIFMQNARPNGFTDGINIINSMDCYIRGNNIVGGTPTNNTPNPLAKTETVGIFMQNSSANTYCCNSLDKIYTGVEVRNVNDVTGDFLTTSFGNHHYGLWLRKRSLATNPIIGGQDFSGNTWNGKTVVGARNEHNSISQINNNQFLIETQVGLQPLSHPVIETPNAIGSEWFKTDNKGVSFICNNGPNGCFAQKPSGNITDVDRLLLDANSNNELSDLTRWQLTRNLYAKLEANPFLINKEEALAIFYEQTKNTAIANFVGIAEGIDYAKTYQISAGNSIEKELIKKEKALINVNEKLQVAEYDAALVKAQQDLYVEITTLFKALALEQVQAEKEKTEMLYELQKRNESIKSELVYENNLQQVNKVILEQLLSPEKTLSKDGIFILENVAYQCDMEGGEAVQTARAMLSWLNINKYSFGRENECKPGGVISKQQKNNNGEVKIYPNPTDGNMVFDCGNLSNTQLSIYDVNGKVVLLQNITDKLTPINISYLSNGIYYCRVLGEEKAIKFTIIH